MKVIAIKNNGDCLVRIPQTDLKLITDTIDDFVEDQVVEVSSKLTVLNQLQRKKSGLVAKLTELTNTINQL